jgi:hypothetical protein
MKTLGLINFEGDVLKLKKITPNKFSILDQHDEIVSELTLKEFCEWIEGKTSITDSDNVDWFYTYQPETAKTSLFDIITHLMK